VASNTPRPTKAERRAAARAKAQALREEQERRERRLKMFRQCLKNLSWLLKRSKRLLNRVRWLLLVK